MRDKVIVIDGSTFSTLQEFYDAVEVLADGRCAFGRNLDAFDDILWHGFGRFEDEEQFTIEWKESAKSQVDLGYAETVKYLRQKLERCHPTNRVHVKVELLQAEAGKGKTLFDILADIIIDHSHIDLVLK